MPARSMLDRYARSVDAVRDFFTMFYGAQITLTEDATEDRILLRVGPSGKIVAITVEFLAEFESFQIREYLAAWNVAHLSRTLERGCRLVVTSEGPEEERD